MHKIPVLCHCYYCRYNNTHSFSLLVGSCQFFSLILQTTQLNLQFMETAV
jgi:hypothetical protein